MGQGVRRPTEEIEAMEKYPPSHGKNMDAELELLRLRLETFFDYSPEGVMDRTLDAALHTLRGRSATKLFYLVDSTPRKLSPN